MKGKEISVFPYKYWKQEGDSHMGPTISSMPDSWPESHKTPKRCC